MNKKQKVIYKDYHGYKIGSDGTIIGLKGKAMRPFTHKDGTIKIAIRINGKKKNFAIARLVYCVFNNIDILTLSPDECVVFRDNNRNNIQLNNLECVKRKDMNKYREQAAIRLLIKQTQEIQNLYDGKIKTISYKKISEKYNLRYFQIYNIINSFTKKRKSSNL